MAEAEWSTDFSVITINPDGTEPELVQVKSQLQSEGHRYGIYVREVPAESRMVVKFFDSQTGSFSDLKIGRDVDLNDIFKIKEFMLTLSNTKAGMIGVRDGEPVGVLTEAALLEYFNQRDLIVRTRMMSDWDMGGKIGKGEPLRIYCAKSSCGALNIVRRNDPGRTKCVNGHILEQN